MLHTKSKLELYLFLNWNLLHFKTHSNPSFETLFFHWTTANILLFQYNESIFGFLRKWYRPQFETWLVKSLFSFTNLSFVKTSFGIQLYVEVHLISCSNFLSCNLWLKTVHLIFNYNESWTPICNLNSLFCSQLFGILICSDS